MPVFRTPDGKIVEERTKHPPLRRPRKESAESQTAATRAGSAGAQAAPDSDSGRYVAPTAVRGGPAATPGTGAGAEGGRTIVVGALGGSASGAETGRVAGWLVIVEGPGTGRDLRIGVGRNELGRNPACRIPLPHGDRRISRRKHLFINYDPENRSFSATPGNGPNLSHCNGSAIVERRELSAHDVIRCGRTKLRFVPFCGDDFTWSDEG